MLNAGSSAARLVDSDCMLSYLAQGRRTRRSMFAIVPERLLRYMGYASKFVFGGRKISSVRLHR